MFDDVYSSQINKQKTTNGYGISPCPFMILQNVADAYQQNKMILMCNAYDQSNESKTFCFPQVLFVFDTQSFHGAGQRDHRMLVFINALFVL